MSDLIMAQNTASPNTPGAGKIALGYNNATGRWEGRLPNGDIVLFQSEYGTQLTIGQKDSDIANATATYATYQTFSLTGLTIGKVYEIEANIVWSLSNKAGEFRARIQIDAVTEGEEISEETGTADFKKAGTLKRFFIATSTSHTVTVQFSSAGTYIATMYAAATKIFNTGLTSIPTG